MSKVKKHIRTLLICNESDLLLSNTEHSNVHGMVWDAWDFP